VRGREGGRGKGTREEEKGEKEEKEDSRGRDGGGSVTY